MSNNILMSWVKQITLRQIIYPAILVVFIVGLSFLVILSVRFLSHHLERALTLDKESAQSEIVRVDLESFNRVARKFGIEPKTKSETLLNQPLQSP